MQKLQKKLLHYAADRNIASGIIFVSRNGKLLNRSNIWRDMKRLCYMTNVPKGTVFTLDLIHLFARMFYLMERDIVKPAGILGHSSINIPPYLHHDYRLGTPSPDGKDVYAVITTEC